MERSGVAGRCRTFSVVVAVASAFVAGVQAQEIPGYPASVDAYDYREIALLPSYCIYTQSFRDRVSGGNNKAAIDGWYARLGPGFHTMHHYCWGLMKTNRALLLSRDQQSRQFYLNDAINLH